MSIRNSMHLLCTLHHWPSFSSRSGAVIVSRLLGLGSVTERASDVECLASLNDNFCSKALKE